MTIGELIDTNTLIHSLSNKLMKVTKHCRKTRRLKSEIDKKLSEHYHKIERSKFNAVEGYYLAKQLQDILQEQETIHKKHAENTQIKESLKDMQKNINTLVMMEGN